MARGDIRLRFAWQTWHFTTSTLALRGRYGTSRHRLSFRVAGVALGVGLGHIDHRFLCGMTSLCGVLVFDSVSRSSRPRRRLPAPPPSQTSRTSHTSHTSHTLFHTQLCHTHTHTIFHTHLSHTTLLQTLFHTQLCHRLSFTHNFVTHNFVTHSLSHTTLSRTLFHTQLCHTQLCHTHHLSHTIFHTHHLSHTTLHIHTTFFTSRSSTTSFVFPSFPGPASTFVAHYWKMLTCGVTRSFNF